MFKQQIAVMPKSITIRDVPDETADELAARAALAGRMCVRSAVGVVEEGPARATEAR
jgi:plasmid stability protein